MQIEAIGSTLMLIVVALFLAAGLDPAVRFFERRGMSRSYAVLTVILAVIAALALFLVAIVPVIADQVRSLTDNAPHWLDQLQRNRQVQRLDDEYDIIAQDPGLRHQRRLRRRHLRRRAGCRVSPCSARSSTASSSPS